jgi:hypothetical protein
MPEPDRIWEPGTSEDLIADAAAVDVTATPRMIADWVESGLLGAPAFYKSSRHGSSARIFSADQRRMFTELLRVRARSPHKRIRTDRLIEPVLYIWLEDNAVVTDQQARRALRTYARGMGHLDSAARIDAAHRIIEQIAHPDASPALRRAAQAMLARIQKESYARSRIEPREQEKLYSMLFDLSHNVALRMSGFERSLGPPQAPVMLAQLFGMWMATVRMKVVLATEQVAEAELAEARAEHIAEWARYQQIRPALHAASGGDRMFQPPPDEEEGYRQKLAGFITLLAGRRGLLALCIEEAARLDSRIRAFSKAPTGPP